MCSKEFKKTASPLPIETVLPAIKARLAEQRNLVLQAPPGAGKTTLVPLTLLDKPWLEDSLMTVQPAPAVADYPTTIAP